MNKLKSLERKIQEKSKKSFNIVLVSFDSENDTPQTLQHYMEKNKINKKNWTWLSQKDEKKIREIAVAINIDLKKKVMVIFLTTA